MKSLMDSATLLGQDGNTDDWHMSHYYDETIGQYSVTFNKDNKRTITSRDLIVSIYHVHVVIDSADRAVGY